MHVLGPLLDGLRVGEPLFPGITPARALEILRLLLAGIGVSNAGQYRTHDLRRGHALDLQLSGLFLASGPSLAQVLAYAGAPLYEILAAGEWRSPAFFAYIDYWRLETHVVVQAHVDESDDEDATS